jgi:hypothetical protein
LLGADNPEDGVPTDTTTKYASNPCRLSPLSAPITPRDGSTGQSARTSHWPY